MEIIKRMNEVKKKVLKHPGYTDAKKSYCQIEMLSDRYKKSIGAYCPGSSTVPREELDEYYELIGVYSNPSILCLELMKPLLVIYEKEENQVCLDVFRKSISILKEQLFKYKGLNRICFAHSVLCRLDIPYANLTKYDPDGFLSKLLTVQTKKIRNMKRQEKLDGLKSYYGQQINMLDPKVFSEEERLPAAIILEAYIENDMSGMKNARYFTTIVASELKEIVDDDTIAEIVKKLISHDHICGEIDGKYHFLLRD
jgi:hypothetical protein